MIFIYFLVLGNGIDKPFFHIFHIAIQSSYLRIHKIKLFSLTNFVLCGIQCDPIFCFWWKGLGRKDSNLRVTGPKPAALPLGHAPFHFYYTLINTIIDLGYSSIPTQIYKNIWGILVLGFNICRYRIKKFIDHYMEFN